jgi:uncharacterized protein
MQLEHHFTVPVPSARAWEALLDVERIAPCMPGATVDSFDGETIEGKVKVNVGPIQVAYAGTAKFVDKDAAAHRAVIEASARESRGAGTAAATITAVLTDAGSSTDVTVTTDLQITGKPAQFGRGVIQDVSDKLLGQFVACLEKNLGATPEPAAAPESSTTEGSASADSGSTAERTESKPQATSSDAGDGELNLLATVGPALAKRYAVPAIGILILLLVLRKLLRH